MNVKFTGFDYISDNDGMGIHVSREPTTSGCRSMTVSV